MNKKKNRILLLISLHAGMIAVIAAYFVVINLLRIGCPIRHFSGIPCPGCGMTRSALSLLSLDVEGFLHYNPLVVLVLPALFCVFHQNTFFLKKISRKLIHGFLVFSGISVILFYLIRMICFSIP